MLPWVQHPVGSARPEARGELAPLATPDQPAGRFGGRSGRPRAVAASGSPGGPQASAQPAGAARRGGRDEDDSRTVGVVDLPGRRRGGREAAPLAPPRMAWRKGRPGDDRSARLRGASRPPRPPDTQVLAQSVDRRYMRVTFEQAQLSGVYVDDCQFYVVPTGADSGGAAVVQCRRGMTADFGLEGLAGEPAAGFFNRRRSARERGCASCFIRRSTTQRPGPGDTLARGCASCARRSAGSCGPPAAATCPSPSSGFKSIFREAPLGCTSATSRLDLG